MTRSMEQKHFEVRSARNAEFFRSDRPWAAIQISHRDDFPVLHDENRVGLLRLVFEDTEEADNRTAWNELELLFGRGSCRLDLAMTYDVFVEWKKAVEIRKHGLVVNGVHRLAVAHEDEDAFRNKFGRNWAGHRVIAPGIVPEMPHAHVLVKFGMETHVVIEDGDLRNKNVDGRQRLVRLEREGHPVPQLVGSPIVFKADVELQFGTPAIVEGPIVGDRLRIGAEDVVAGLAGESLELGSDLLKLANRAAPVPCD